MVAALVIRQINALEALISFPSILVFYFRESFLSLCSFYSTLSLRSLFLEKPEL
jgi:hypothetical protein